MRRLALVAVLLAFLVPPAVAGPVDEARGLVDERKYDEAQRILERTVEEPGQRIPSLFLLAELSNARERYEDGIRYSEQLIELLPRNSQAHYLRAQALRIKITKISRVRAMFVFGDYKKQVARSLELDPNNADAREEEIGWLINAPGIVGGSKSRGRERIEELKAVDWRRGMGMQAELARIEDDQERLGRTFREILERDPDDVRARFALGYWLQRHERFAEADRLFEELTEKESDRYALDALYQRARTRILGKYEPEKAVAFLEQYLERVPEDYAFGPSRSAALWRMGNAYEQLADVAGARRAYQQALDLDSENDRAKQALRALPRS